MEPVEIQRQSYLKYMQEKRALALSIGTMRTELADAEMQQELLDLDYQIGQANAAAPDPTDDFQDLAEATASCQQIEETLNGLDVFCSGEMKEIVGPMVNGILRPMIQERLTRANARRDAIQKAIESTPQTETP